jgi:predicted TIM-barrel fold metal-dependent hydrolase
MAVDTGTVERQSNGRRSGVGLVDCDVHPWPTAEQLLEFMDPRWADYQRAFGLRGPTGRGALLMRPFSARMDAWPPGGGYPGSDSTFAREQLLDRYDITHAILNPPPGLFPTWTGGNQPREYSADMMKALNDWIQATWLEADERWRAAVCVTPEQPDAAAAEIARCVNQSDKFLQVMLPVRMHHPVGNPFYAPLIEAAIEHDIVVGIHVGGDGMNQVTGGGPPSYFYENHTGFGQAAFSHISSLIFEGTFERYPQLKIVLMETNWSWLAPLAWRMDATWEVLKSEVPHVKKRPSEYLRDHLFITSQPAEEFENAAWFDDVYGQFESLGMDDNFMFATDYPHWDFDSPEEALPTTLAPEKLDRMLWGTASKLYGLKL